MKQEFDLIFKIVALLGIFVLYFTGCGTEPEFERDNKNDPSSDNFEPDIGNIRIHLLPNKDVKIDWSILSDFGQGYIISKQLGSTTQYTVLDTLPPNTNAYIDTSKIFNKFTTYALSPYTDKNEAINYLKAKKNKFIMEIFSL